MKITNQILALILFSVLSLIIVLPLAKPGYILTLDAVITPKVSFAPLTSSSFFYQNILAILNLYISADWLEKIILFFIFFLSGWGMYRLVDKNLGISRYFAGIFYAVNPFVYERVMAGHWQLLLGYSIFPFVVASTINYFHDATKKNSLLLAIIATLLFNVAIHYLLIFIVFFIMFGVTDVYLNRHNKEKLTKITRQAIPFIVITFILNSNWIISSVLGISDISQSITQFTRSDLISFQSVSDSRLGLIFNLLSGYGFWAEVYHDFILPKDIIIIWPILSAVVMLIFVLGLYGFIKEKSNLPMLVTLLVLFLLAADFAGGIALNSFNQLYFFLYEKFPILYSLREPQKLVGIIMLCFAFFGSYGLYYFLNRVKEKFKFFVLCSWFLVLPFIYTPTVFGGFWGQLSPVFYPTAWYEINKILSKDKDNFSVLFFPWHQYMQFRFANNRVVANPAPYFFDKPILSSLNYETAYLYTHDIRPESLHVEGLLSIEKEGVNLLGENVYEKESWGKALSPINVKYIILVKEDDWRRYRFLDEQNDIKKIFESSEIDLYQNLNWGIVEEEIELLDSFGVFLVS